MLYVRIIVGIALLLMAAFGPGIGIRPAGRQRRGADAIGQANAAGARTGTRDQKMAAVLILRVLAAMVGFWLIFFSIAEVLHGYGHL